MKEKCIWIPDFRLQNCFVFNLSNMKEVENLLQTPFFRLKIEEKREMKRLGPHHPKEIPHCTNIVRKCERSCIQCI